MNDRDIERSPEPPDEKETYTCDICKEEHELDVPCIEIKDCAICIFCLEYSAYRKYKNKYTTK